MLGKNININILAIINQLLVVKRTLGIGHKLTSDAPIISEKLHCFYIIMSMIYIIFCCNTDKLLCSPISKFMYNIKSYYEWTLCNSYKTFITAKINKSFNSYLLVISFNRCKLSWQG